MQTTTLSLAIMLLCSTAATQAFAQPAAGLGGRAQSLIQANAGAGNRPGLSPIQQGSGASVGASSQAGTSAAVGHALSFGAAQGQGAVRALGQGNTSGAASVGAQFKASGATNPGGISTSMKTRGQVQTETHGPSLHSRARNEILARGRVTQRQISDSKLSVGSDSSKIEHASATAKVKAGGEVRIRSPREQNGASTPESLLANRLASIDHMRDIALEHGNQRMLDEADKLEALARQQYQRRSGEFSVNAAARASGKSKAEASGNTSLRASSTR